ncbi:nucleoside-diphosphate-sugar epimerase [Spirochaetia bacterium]|nr:nucleoside-diphosphate-sugar epimerase [Spirochaetia bacterium]
MNILITGIHGFVGSNIALALHEHRIYGLSNSSSKKEGYIQTYSWYELDKVHQHHIDTIIHLAGKAHDTKNQSEYQSYFDINTGLTQKIFDWFLQSDAEKFIFFSSVKAAADTVQGILTEDVIPAPKGPYGESKLKAEEYIKTSLGKIENQSNKQVYILRPCMIHGPGNKGNLNLLYNAVQKGIPWPLGAFDNQRSFISIDNVSYIIKQLLEQDIVSGIYNLADDETLSTTEVMQIMCHTLSRKCKIYRFNKNLIRHIALLGSMLHLPLNQERLKKLTENYIVSNEKIKKYLNIDRLPLSAKDGFIKTIRSFESGIITV